MLEIDEDPGFQRKQLRVARAAMALFVVLIGLALLGVFGSGPFSHATAGEARDGVTVDYQRFLRFGQSTDVEVSLDGEAGTSTVAVDGDYLDGFDLDAVVPEPAAQTMRGGRLRFTYEDPRPTAVILSLTPRRVGLRRAGVSVDGGPAVSFRQLVYP